MVVVVRKNMMLLLENKLSYIFCVVGAGVTNVKWACWFVKLHQRSWLACWFAYFCVHFNILPCVLWNLSQLWLGYSFDSGVVGLEINVCYYFWNVNNCCLFHYWNLMRPVRPYQWGFYKMWWTRPSPRSHLRGWNCPLSAMGVKVSLACSKQYRFSPHVYIFPIRWSNQLNQSMKLIYAPLA